MTPKSRPPTERDHEFAIRYDRLLRPLFTALGTGPGLSRAVVGADELHVGMGWAFRGRVPLSAVVSARTERIPLLMGVGVHGWGGRWAVNGSRSGAVRVDVDPPSRARVCGLPVQLRTLWLSLVDPDAFVAAVRPPRTAG